MPAQTPPPFALDAHPDKADPALIDADVRQFSRIAVSVARQIADLDARVRARRRAPADDGQAALERDLDVHRMTARLRLLRRFGPDLCLGRTVTAHGALYIGRLALADDDGEPLLIDWRAPAAEPFFGATHGTPMGLISRRRYRWANGRITDYWDEAFTADARVAAAALDDQSAFIASLATSRSLRMRDVLGTIQADQDAIIRAGSRGTLVVDGGPGTGKTVVALHRAAYLLYADPQLQAGHGGILFIGPSSAYTSYVADILPGLGEEGVPTRTIADLVPDVPPTMPEPDRRVARVKADGRMPAVVDAVVDRYERVPRRTTVVDTEWGDVHVTTADWDEAFGAADPTSTHNDAREDIWRALLAILVDRVGARTNDDRDDAARWGDDGWGDAGSTAWDGERRAEDEARRGFDDEAPFDAYGMDRPDDAVEAVTRALGANPQLRAAMDDAWPRLDPVALVRGLWTSPPLLRRCAPWLAPSDVELLQRPADHAWTREDLPLLDAARRRVGDPAASARRRRAEAEAAAERARMADVIDDLIATDDSELRVMSMLRGQDMRGALAASPPSLAEGDRLAGPFAHIVVDEAQELTDAEWQMLLCRNPSRSFTVVGDRAQARHGFPSSWQQRLTAVGLRDISLAPLTVNYRTPAEIMVEAAPVIRAVVPDANVPTSVRRTGIPVRHGDVDECDDVVRTWLASHAEGTVCVVGDAAAPTPAGEPDARVQRLDPAAVKGLEFDLVVLVDGARFTVAGAGGPVEAAVDRYVAMTRATGELVILHPWRRPPSHADDVAAGPTDGADGVGRRAAVGDEEVDLRHRA